MDKMEPAMSTTASLTGDHVLGHIEGSNPRTLCNIDGRVVSISHPLTLHDIGLMPTSTLRRLHAALIFHHDPERCQGPMEPIAMRGWIELALVMIDNELTRRGGKQDPDCAIFTWPDDVPFPGQGGTEHQYESSPPPSSASRRPVNSDSAGPDPTRLAFEPSHEIDAEPRPRTSDPIEVMENILSSIQHHSAQLSDLATQLDGMQKQIQALTGVKTPKQPSPSNSLVEIFQHVMAFKEHDRTTSYSSSLDVDVNSDLTARTEAARTGELGRHFPQYKPGWNGSGAAAGDGARERAQGIEAVRTHGSVDLEEAKDTQGLDG